ncbi:MAG: aminotransferase class I/II-fold pyridoxal phosphate-dependent enzyme [Oscillospiraceae bacterium]|nr:aminotransferase class I/II-fold pyridoxal phosphate-dependent enzyme [Oscillospiraceae bacterium]
MRIKHGGGEQAKIDFSVSLNPLGIPCEAKQAASEADFERYPDTECAELISAISKYEKVDPKQIVCGNGAADLIYRIVGAVKPKIALIVEPTFAEYEKALCESDCTVEKHFLSESDGFALNGDFLDKIKINTDIVFLCNPNNPTGIITELIGEIARKCADTKTLLVVDECFMDFVENSEEYSAKQFLNKYTIILKAFTKSYSMAGLRLGYAIFGDSVLCEKIKEYGQPWSVSSAAQAAGIAALGISDYLERARELIKSEHEYLSNELTSMGICVFSSQTNFLLLKSDYPLKEMLMKKSILIRSCDNFEGLGKDFFRIAVRTHEENTSLINALKELI